MALHDRGNARMKAVDLDAGSRAGQRWAISEPAYAADRLNAELELTPWQAHRDFAYDLISFMRPRLIVELGVHYGCSYFSFCQAVSDRSLDTKVIGVDTWKGDEHAGFYGEEVFDLVSTTRDTCFPDLRFVLERSTFDDAAAEIADGSVDLLHIDGLHTYDAVSRDYHTWLPKLSEDGIVLMHDIAESSGYESARFWRELRQRHPHFEFLNHWGLGILFPKGHRWYRACDREGLPEKLRGYRYRGEFLLYRGRAEIDRREIERLNGALGSALCRVASLKQRVARLETWLKFCTLGIAAIVIRVENAVNARRRRRDK